ncbi:YhgE/Pip domain-containing protein [Romboutsia sp. 1001216sp1]|uniref:YhgE/Pip domain-containing protein n=1 Tax=unclassified Romboutsia TaxID=2626894 RepID=UPI00189F68D7|nr:YhgE/Pip domain-containing protein [Romboutsia sp. 1001216sp1]MDB8791860.1 YhgE/Pip domain-containing protein [Romboutsia sp. 1001216sp1]MDB8801632.1 YhgE/Pip domain-containing protein [Romboutsia sp. 1001216sp1]MDB8813029.1 YhgE/Pip domain-containing protein [Romboutsia sp. 1001216sp1]
MKNIFKIYKKDIKDIFTNKVLLVIILGLTVLPSLYAWFNIKASWDPYGSTKNISVAIVNNDKGTEIRGKDINVGDELVKKLKENDNLGWKFVDKADAINGVKKGTYYASVEIPESFSKDLTSLTSDEVKKGKIIYTVNEKINAIAPKITDKGASTIQNEVNQTVVKTVSQIIFEVSNNLGIELENQLPKLSNLESELIDVQSKFKDIYKTVNLASDATDKVQDLAKELKKDVPLITSTISNTKKLASDVKVFLQDSKGSLDKVAPVIKEDLQIVSKVSSSASSNISSIIDAINNGADNVPQLIDSLSSKLSTLSSTSNTVLDFLNKLNAIKPGGPLENAISSLQSINNSLNNATNALNAIKGQIANGEKPSLDKLNSVLKVVNDVNQISTSILNNFDSKIVNPINNIFEGSFNTANEVISVLDKAQAKLPQVEDILNTTISLSDSAKDNISFIRKKLPIAKSTIDELVNAMKKINSSDDVNELISLLKSDAIKRAEFLKQPVELVTDKLYPVANYGAGMTPFYTVLSLWVGVLLLMSLLSANVHGDYKPFEIYFGRGLTFLTIAIIQAFIVSAGDLYILNVKVIDPLSFVLLSMFTSIVFTAIVYSLVSIFGNVGKAIGVILLVIQVAASGGTFPIQVTPPFFQYVNPFLPFTYAISALRETVGGIYKPVLIKDIYVLIVFLIIPIILTILFKGIINKYTKPISDKFNESDLTGH